MIKTLIYIGAVGGSVLLSKFLVDSLAYSILGSSLNTLSSFNNGLTDYYNSLPKMTEEEKKRERELWEYREKYCDKHCSGHGEWRYIDKFTGEEV